MAELKTYQEANNKIIASHFTKSKDDKTNETWSFTLGEYDHSQTLIIDPLIYSTYIGGGIDDKSNSLVNCDSGYVVITGYTSSINYDVTLGSFQSVFGGNQDVFVTKLNSNGSALIFSTFIGGNMDEIGTSITIDMTESIYVTGSTNSTNFYTTSGAFQTSNDGDHDIFITKLNNNGTGLIYSTLLGGSSEDFGSSITIDTSNNVYITGHTSSTDFDVTQGAYQTTFAGYVDVYVSKLNSLGTTLIYSTYIGGISDDRGFAITIDSTDNVYITGYTGSVDYDVTQGAYQTTFGGYLDAFVSKLNTVGNVLIYSTYLGGNDYDSGYSIAIDTSYHVYITGFTQSIDFDVTLGGFQLTFEGINDAFVTKFNTTGTALVYSTYLGGNLIDRGYSIVLDKYNNVYIAGVTQSINFDVTPNAYQINRAAGFDVFVSKIDSLGSTLIYSTFLGGLNDDVGNSIALDPKNNIYITGFSTSIDFDTTAGAYQTTLTGGKDVFITKLDILGTSKISETTKTNLFYVYPNPSQGVYQIEVEKGSHVELYVEVSDMQGKIVYKEPTYNQHKFKLYLSNQPSGVYLLKVRTDKNQEIQQLIKL